MEAPFCHTLGQVVHNRRQTPMKALFANEGLAENQTLVPDNGIVVKPCPDYLLRGDANVLT
ncbi:unnamed protein product, partial [Fusarium fujikuroi]